jgi:N-carbamoyl-L-amino-acid hydrolase
MAASLGSTGPDLELALRLFDELRSRTGGEDGITRDSYGPGEQTAHEIVAAAAKADGLEVCRDAAANLYVTLPGRNRAAPILLMGSHLDSVPHGGNFDGAAGVIAGVATLAALRRANQIPAFDLTVMAIRAEEAAWFDASYVGSRAAFGLLTDREIDGVRRSDTGRTLAEHMIECGADPAALRRGERFLATDRLRGFIELHIEQGPILERASTSVGIVTGIRGCRRFRNARCIGGYAHSGAEPRNHRSDAVAATVALIARLEAEWIALETAGHDLTFTVGELYTDAALHGPSKVAGETRFVLDFRSLSDAIMLQMCERSRALAVELGRVYRVNFELGEPLFSAPALLDADMRRRIAAAASMRGTPSIEMASGAGHDASVFANLGVPTGMIFVRNAHGSHNSSEAMEMRDFAAAARILFDVVAEEAIP